MATIDVTLNFLGVPVPEEYVDRILDGSAQPSDFEYKMIRHVLELPPESLPREVLERYVEISDRETYTPLLPHTDKLLERFLFPFRSAKRLYCLGEYLAAIEICAHVGEMFSLLIWQMTPITFNGNRLNVNTEKAIWGRTFEKMGQENRINLLETFGAISNEDARSLDFLRATRRTHFHFWTIDADVKKDALDCFLRLAKLVKNVLKIEYDGKDISINPLLQDYLRTQRS